MGNRKRVRRVWRALGLQATRKKRRKLRTGQPRVLTATGPNQVCAYDFVHDACANGQTLKCLTVVDEWTRECLAIEVASSLDAARVIAVRRVSGSGVVREPARGAEPDRAVALGVQYAAAAQQSQLSDAGRGRSADEEDRGRISPHHDGEPVMIAGPKNGDSPQEELRMNANSLPMNGPR